ncbi:MAG: SpoIIE family protein phosphatase [Clostridia bacterium]
MATEAETGKKSIRLYVRRNEFKLELLTLIAAALSGRVCLYGDVVPFALAFLAAVGMSGMNVHYAFIGGIIGCALLPWPLQLPSVCACALYYALYLIWIKWKKDCGKFDKLVLLFLVQVALMPVFYRNGLETVLRGLISLGVSSISALIMQNALRTVRTVGKRHVLTDGEQLSLSAFFGVILLSVTDIRAFGFSLPVVLLLLFAMIASLARGIAGVAVSVALAVVLTIGGEFSLIFVGSIAACTLAGATLRSLDTLGVIGGFVGCSLLVGTYVFTASHTINLLNLAAAGGIFLMVPRDSMLQLCSYLDAEKNRERYARKAMKRMRMCTAMEMRRAANVVNEMARLYQPGDVGQEPSDALMQWTAQAAYGVCSDCPLKKPCWKDWQRAAETVIVLLQCHERGERIRIRKPFDPSCKHMQQIAAAAWQAQNQYLVQRAMKKQTAEQYAFVNRQLIGVCDIIAHLSERVTQDKWLDEELEQMLLRGLDRRGYRVFGVDAFFPDGKLQLHVRLPASMLYFTETFSGAVEQILRRPIRILHADIDGKQCTLLMEEAQQLTACMGTATIAISNSGISGDSTGERRMERGRVLYALSDGMGAGVEAKGESDSALRLLFDLYDAGFSRDVALESVNRLLLGRSEDMYATLDAVYVDLRSGEAEFMKYGAPPSFVYRGEKLHTVCAEALPAGILHEAVPAVAVAQLKRNDTVLLFSDGALDALGDYTREAIAASLKSTRTSQEAAQALLNIACDRKREDDMTVMVIKIA